ncbi:MAG: GHKL domain-containing protein [Deferribacteres bacterium]|nr:GHKL domain-containing protein [candidate division KSB1 bacterium]MCB9500487.1 GHKL domain-containing protein [Deferribacteres bacterium]
MHSLRKIRAFFIFIVLVPSVFIIVYQFLSLAEHKNLIEDTYREQLKTILYSVNQNTRNIIESWIALYRRSVTIAGRQSAEEVQKAIDDFLTIDSEIVAVIRFDRNLDYFEFNRKEATHIDRDFIFQQLKNENIKASLRKLAQLHEKQFLTFEPVYVAGDSAHESLIFILFTREMPKGAPDYAGFILPANAVIENMLAPEMRRVAGSDFVLTCFQSEDSRPVYSTDDQLSNVFDLTNKLWIMPGFQLGIRLEIAELPGLLREQFQRTVWFLAFLSSILVVAAFLIYRTIRKEIYLAQLKSDFISNVSHELKTPLALIRMFAETLELGRLQDEKQKQEYYEIIGHETERLSHKVNNILNFSRMEAEKKTYSFQRIDLNEIITKLIHNYAYHIENNGFKLEKDIAPAPLIMHGDSDALIEAFINVVDNAMKYSKEEKFLRISTSQREKHIIVTIEDHGIGIHKEHQKRIFEKFYRVSGALIHETKGSGLGLSLVQHIIDAHKGFIEVKSEPAKGTIFRFIFPVAD